MNRSFSPLIVSGLILISGLIGAECGLAQTATEQREAAVLRARAGQMTEALADLRGMLKAGKDDNGLVAMDLATLLQQAKRPREAVSVFEKAAPAKPPDYALLATTRAYRDLHRYSDAARLARRGMADFPKQPVWPLLLSLVLSDARHPREALAALHRPEAEQASQVERLLAEGYAWRRAGEVQKAKDAYARVLKLADASKAARDEASKALRDIDATARAARNMGVAPAPA